MWKQTDFYETTVMPTYMVSLTVSDFKCTKTSVHSEYSTNLTVGVCGIPNRANEFDLALSLSKKSLEFLEDFFKTGSNLTKLGKT